MDSIRRLLRRLFHEEIRPVNIETEFLENGLVSVYTKSNGDVVESRIVVFEEDELETTDNESQRNATSMAD